LKHGKGAEQSHCDMEAKKNDDSNRNTDIIATIISGVDDKELNVRCRNA